MGLYSLLSSAVHFCPDGYICGNVRKPATLCICIWHWDDQILTVNSFTWNCWNRLRAVPSLPLTVPYITLQRSRPVLQEVEWNHLSKVWICLQIFGHVCTLIEVLCLIEQGIVRSAWKRHLSRPFSIDFLQMIWIFHLLQYQHLNLVSMSWKHYGKFGLMVSAKRQPRLDMCNNKFHFVWPTLQRFYM